MTPYYDKAGITIYCGENSKVLKKVIEDNSIDLTVTSPPYDLVDENMITHSDKGIRDYQGYTWDFVTIAEELWRVTTKGGVVVWVVGDATVNGSETGSSFRQALYFKDVGFKLSDTMIYEAAGTGAKGSNKTYWQSFEFMFVLCKGVLETYNLLTCPHKNPNKPRGFRAKSSKLNSRVDRLNYRNPETSKKSNVWRYAVGTNDRTDHDAPFPEPLAKDHILSWSNPGNLILDPFLGSGTTLKMAQELGRRGIGIEISEEYCQIAVDRLRQPSFFSIPDKPKKNQVKQLEIVYDNP
jgi:site-specific DNA-methyltransferase (adenine-specific)